MTAMYRPRGHQRWNLRIFGGSSHPELSKLVARKAGVKLGDVVLGKFANKETQVEIREVVRGQNIFVIQTGGGHGDPHDYIMETLFIANACKLAAAATVTAVIPLYFYSKADSKDTYRMSITGKLVANMLKKAGVDHVMILDPHSAQLEGFFDMPVDSLKVEPLFCQWIRENIEGYRDTVVMCPDEFGVRRVIMIADELDIDYAVVNSRRRHRTEMEKLGPQHRANMRHRRLNHQHLSDNWQLVEEERDQVSQLADEIDRNLSSEKSASSEDTESSEHDGTCSDEDEIPPPAADVTVEDGDYHNQTKKVSVERKARRSIASTGNTTGHPSCQENEEHEIFETRISGNVEGKKVILIDDVIDTGRNLKSAVAALKKEGASCAYVLATHGAFSAEAYAAVQGLDFDFVKLIAVTNSIPQDVGRQILGDRLSVIDISGLIAEVIRRHHYCESISMVCGEFQPDFKQQEGPVAQCVARIGTHRVVQVNNAEKSTVRPLNRPMEILRKGYRLSSKCWD